MTQKLVTVIGRGHSGTRAMARTLLESGVHMGAELNGALDLIPPEEMYDACRVLAKHVAYCGDLQWDFSEVVQEQPNPRFVKLIKSYLGSVLSSDATCRGWKIPESILIFPWLVQMFPEAYYIHWVRDPRDVILGRHLTDDLNDFGISCPSSDEQNRHRAVSWKYQADIIMASLAPSRWIVVRFEDFVRKQEQTLSRLEAFLGIPLARIPVNRDAVGRYRSDASVHNYDFLRPYLVEYGYERQ